jgi:hypothetical protein
VAARAPVEAFFGFAVGAVELAAGSVLLGWALLTHAMTARGFDAAHWAFRQSPVALPGTPELLAEMAVHPNVYWGVAIAGAVLAAFGLESFWRARRNLRPANESNDGKIRLELKAPARLGRWLDGEFVLLRGGQAGDAYDVRLACTRKVRKYRSTVDSDNESYMATEVRYDQRVHSEAVPAAAGLAVPFRFEIPAGMPAHRSGHFMRSLQFQWKIRIGTPKAWFPTGFPLDVRPLAAGEAGPIGEPVPEDDGRDWGQVELTAAEARELAAAEERFSRFGLWLVGAFSLLIVLLFVISAFNKAR